MISLYNILESLLDDEDEIVGKVESNFKREKSKAERALKKIIAAVSKAGNWEIHTRGGKYNYKECTIGIKVPGLIEYLGYLDQYENQANTMDVSKYISIGFEVKIEIRRKWGEDKHKIKYNIFLSKSDPKYCVGGFSHWNADPVISTGEIMMERPTLAQIIKPYILPEIKDLDTIYERFSKLTQV
jgi:hypothetical protein